MVACSSAVCGRYRMFGEAARVTRHSATDRTIRPESRPVHPPVHSGANGARRCAGYLCLSRAGETLTSPSPWQHSSQPLGGQIGTDGTADGTDVRDADTLLSLCFWLFYLPPRVSEGLSRSVEGIVLPPR